MVSLKSSGNFGMGAMKKVQRFCDTPPIATLTKFPNFAFAFAPFLQNKKKLCE